MSSFFIKQHDTGPDMEYVLLDEDGAPIDVTGATVTFHMQDDSGVEKIIDGVVTLTTPASGVVTYEWQDGDTDQSGMFFADFLITFAGGQRRTSPNPGWITVIVSSSIRAESSL